MHDDLERHARYRRGQSNMLDPDPIANGPWAEPDVPAPVVVKHVIAWLDAAENLRAAGLPPLLPDTVREAWRRYAREIQAELAEREREGAA